MSYRYWGYGKSQVTFMTEDQNPLQTLTQMHVKWLLVLLAVAASSLRAQSPAALYTAPSAVDAFVAKHPEAKQVSAQKDGVLFRTSKGLVMVAGRFLTYQDAAGQWRVTAPQITSDNAGGWVQSGTPLNVAIAGNGASKHLRLGSGSDAWDVTLPSAAYVGKTNFTFESGGQTWRLRMLPEGAQIESTVSSKSDPPRNLRQGEA
jgi:hypothetical protein